MSDSPFKRGEKVRKIGGDYSFTGRVFACEQKLKPPHPWRVVVESRTGMLMIFNATQVKRVKERGR